MDDYADYDALGLAELVAKGEVTAGELLNAAVSRAEKAQAQLNCFANLFPDLAEKQIAEGLGDGDLDQAARVVAELPVPVREVAGSDVAVGGREHLVEAGHDPGLVAGAVGADLDGAGHGLGRSSVIG